MTLRRKHLHFAPIRGLVRLARFLQCDGVHDTDDEAARETLVRVISRRLTFHGKYVDF